MHYSNSLTEVSPDELLFNKGEYVEFCNNNLNFFFSEKVKNVILG